ncbi:MAG: carboxypeptidase regulatory-like domain-containing protein, partial [Ignavibacteria bacterium]|nr:carboxypeptidase regulatory-like domain-containing protein [Ignavibacteria bacterium]
MKKLSSFILLITITALIANSISQAQETKPPIAAYQYQYSTSIEINKTFEHKIEVKLPTTMIPLEFILLKGPEGMKVDKEKGIVAWKPINAGTYVAEFAINYQGAKVGSAVLKLLVLDYLGSISGIISNEEAKLLAGATVIVYKKFSSTEKGDFFSPLYKTTTDQNGAYTFTRVEAGTYVVSAELRYDKSDPAATYLPVWYENALTMDKATIVEISQTVPKFEANIILHKSVKVIEPPITITIANYFSLSVGEAFSYQVSEKLRAPAIQNPNYSLGRFPEGMTIDAASGRVNWTPTIAGEYAAEIIVKSGTTKVAVEVLKFKVVNFYGVVGGVVKDEVGTPLPNILITLNKKINVSQKDSYMSALSALTKSDGTYLIEKVEGGDYFVYARQALERSNIKPTAFYQSVWYVDALTIDKATAVKIADKNKVDVSFVLKKIVKVEPVLATVMGKVTDAQSKPIANANVIVAGVTKGVSGSMMPNNPTQYGSFQASSYGVFGDVAFKTLTDKDG